MKIATLNQKALLENLEKSSLVPITMQVFDGAVLSVSDTLLFLSSNSRPLNVVY